VAGSGPSLYRTKGIITGDGQQSELEHYKICLDEMIVIMDFFC
jgi:hypothetical protein